MNLKSRSFCLDDAGCWAPASLLLWVDLTCICNDDLECLVLGRLGGSGNSDSRRLSCIAIDQGTASISSAEILGSRMGESGDGWGSLIDAAEWERRRFRSFDLCDVNRRFGELDI